jgi:uncharacterized protein YjeT (DUF2065 family)
VSDLAVALGLVFVIEGLLWALAPRLGRQLLEAAYTFPEASLRFAGAASVSFGVLVVWLVRG